MTAGDPIRSFSREVRRKDRRLGAITSAVVRKTASDIERDAKQNAPVDTGNLRASIGATYTGDGRMSRMSAEIGPTANYAQYVELGTYKMAAQPYLFPAADRHEAAFYEAMAKIADL